jgi:FkbM family methyltransferase
MLARSTRTALRWFTQHVPIRGRMKLADKLGALIAPPGPEELVVNGLRIQLDHSILTHRLMYYDLYEENVMNFLKGYLRPGMIVLDAGANIGYFAAKCVGMIKPGGHVFSFEPSATCLALAERIGQLHGSRERTLIPQAISDSVGTSIFYDTPRVITKGYACLSGTHLPSDRVEHPVSITTIDTFCTERGISHVDLLKLDIEGSEVPALRGSVRMLEEGRIAAIIVEMNTEGSKRQEAIAVVEMLQNAGMRSFHLQRNGRPVPIDVLARTDHREDVLWMSPARQT